MSRRSHESRVRRARNRGYHSQPTIAKAAESSHNEVVGSRPIALDLEFGTGKNFAVSAFCCSTFCCREAQSDVGKSRGPEHETNLERHKPNNNAQSEKDEGLDEPNESPNS
jgi:hypothetical protein